MEKSRENSRILDMTKGNPFHLILTFALPLFFGNLLQQFYNLADTAIAGHILGDAALAQIGATAALYSLITNFAFGMNNGLALAVSRAFGAGNKPGIKKAVGWMVILSMGTAVLLAVLFVAFRLPLLQLLQVPQDTMAGALSYLNVILMGIPLTMAYNMESAMLQAVGNSVTPLFFLLGSSVLNIILDICFMGPLAMGIRGAAIATVLAQGISALLAFLLICRRYPLLRFDRADIHTSPDFVWRMYSAGLSMALMSAIYNIGSVVLQGSINALGNLYITAQTGARRLAEFFYTPGLALGTSVATYTSQNLGGGCRKRIGKGIFSGIFLYGVWWIVAMLFAFTIAPQAVQLVTGTTSRDIISNAVLYLQISIPVIPPMAVLVIVRNALQGMGYMVMPLICSGLELAGKLVFALWIVPVQGYIAVCLCEPVTWVICCAFILGCVWKCRREFAGDTSEKISHISSANVKKATVSQQ